MAVPNDRLRHMRIGYARVSKADGSQSLDLQRDALRAGGVDAPLRSGRPGSLPTPYGAINGPTTHAASR